MICPKTKMECQYKEHCIGTGHGGYAGDDCHLVFQKLERQHKKGIIIMLSAFILTPIIIILLKLL